VMAPSAVTSFVTAPAQNASTVPISSIITTL
jgi:hypothetical protein